jgi:hypothetical protein
MPSGTRPILHDGKVFLFEGSRSRVHDEVAIKKMWRVSPERVSVLDAESLEVITTAAAPSEVRDLLGVDQSGGLVASTPRGIALLSADELHELDRVDLGEVHLPFLAHAWPELNAVAAGELPPGPALDLDLIVFRVRAR